MIGGGIFIAPIMSVLNLGQNNVIINSIVDTFLPEGHYRKYRKKLEQLAKYSEEYNKSKYVESAEKISKIVDDIPVDMPIIESVASAVKADIPIPTFEISAINSEILRAISYIELQIELYDNMIKEEEESFIMMLNLL